MKNQKDFCLPTYKKLQEKNVIKHENTPIAHVFFNVLSFEGSNTACKKISLFYKRLVENFTKWVNIDFEQYARKDYLSDTNPRKKFRYIPFTLTIDMTPQIKDNTFLEVKTSVKLYKRKTMISEKNINHLWNLKNGTLQIMKRQQPKV